MNLDKAKERLDVLSLPGNVYLTLQDVEAIKIGHEAIGRIQHQREIGIRSAYPLIKGETIGKL